MLTVASRETAYVRVFLENEQNDYFLLCRFSVRQDLVTAPPHEYPIALPIISLNTVSTPSYSSLISQ